MTNLIIKKDSRGTSTWARELSEDAVMYTLVAYDEQTISVPTGAKICIISGTVNFCVGESSVTVPSDGNSISGTFDINPSTVIVEGLTSIFLQTFSNGSVNVAFYDIVG